MNLTHYKISVTELLEFSATPVVLRTIPQFHTRAQEGIAGHQLLASARPEGFQAEVPVEYEYRWQNLHLTVHGRIDGLIFTETGIIVEEIKTTYLQVDNLKEIPYPLHLTQIQIYLYFIMCQYPHLEITGRLTYLNLEDLSERSFPVTLTLNQARDNFEVLAQKYLTYQKENSRWLETRNHSLRGLVFPFPQLRPGQEELIKTVNQALQQEQDLFIEAATGIGKTISVLFPSLMHLATSKLIRRIFFLTAKTAGKDILRKTLNLLNENGLRLRSVFIEAKERICLSPGSQCHSCPYTANYYEKIESVLPKLLFQELITPELITSIAQQEQLCPFELSLDSALNADLIICDYNYLFDPGVYLRRFFLSPGKRDSLFLIDEAHNLVNRGREMYSASLSQKDLESWAIQLEPIKPELADYARKIGAIFDEYHCELEENHQQSLLLTSLNPLLEPTLEQWIAFLEKTIRQTPLSISRDQMLDIYFELTKFMRIIPLINRNYAIYVKSENHNLTLKILCLNPGPQLRKRLDMGRSAIFFSATLSPHQYFRQLLGGNEDALQIRLPSPFPKENRLYLHVPGIDTRYRARSKSLPKLIECITTTVLSHTGNYLAFFPSYAYLQMVFPLLREHLKGQTLVYAQFPGMTGKTKEQFLSNLFRKHPNQSKLGLAVLGGSFSEGIDLPGEQLIGVIIIGLGMPMVNEEQELIRMYFDEWSNSGFFYAYLIPGLIKVIQAAGRVFRTSEDTGVVMLVDDRFADERYQQLLPPDWFLSGRSFSDPEYQETLKEFWNNAPQKN